MERIERGSNSAPRIFAALVAAVACIGMGLASFPAQALRGGGGMRGMARPAINLPAGGFHGGGMRPGEHGAGTYHPPGPGPHPGPHPGPGPGPDPHPGPGPHPPGPGPGPGPHPPGPHPVPPPPYWGWDDPFWDAALFTAGVAATSALIGSTVYALPQSCTVVTVDNVTYQQCGGNWFRPQYVGTTVQYIVVAPPY